MRLCVWTFRGHQSCCFVRLETPGTEQADPAWQGASLLFKTVSDGVASRESHSIIRAVLIHTKQISPRWHVKERKNGGVLGLTQKTLLKSNHSMGHGLTRISKCDRNKWNKLTWSLVSCLCTFVNFADFATTRIWPGPKIGKIGLNFKQDFRWVDFHLFLCHTFEIRVNLYIAPRCLDQQQKSALCKCDFPSYTPVQNALETN